MRCCTVVGPKWSTDWLTATRNHACHLLSCGTCVRYHEERECAATIQYEPLLQDQVPSYNVTAQVLDWYIYRTKTAAWGCDAHRLPKWKHPWQLVQNFSPALPAGHGADRQWGRTIYRPYMLVAEVWLRSIGNLIQAHVRGTRPAPIRPHSGANATALHPVKWNLTGWAGTLHLMSGALLPASSCVPAAMHGMSAQVSPKAPLVHQDAQPQMPGFSAPEVPCCRLPQGLPVPGLNVISSLSTHTEYFTCQRDCTVTRTRGGT